MIYLKEKNINASKKLYFVFTYKQKNKIVICNLWYIARVFVDKLFLYYMISKVKPFFCNQ